MMDRLFNSGAVLSTPALVAGVLGLVAFLLLYPAVHPDSSVRRGVPEQLIRQRADSLMTVLSGSPPEFHVTLYLRRHADLLSHLQSVHGLRTLTAALRRDEVTPLPVYYYQVRYFRASTGDEERALVAEMRFDLDGRLVHVETRGVQQRAGNPEALRSIGVGPDTTGSRRIIVMSDRGDADDVPDVAGTRIDLEQLARYHLRNTAWSDLPLVTDSVRLSHSGETATATIIFRPDTLVWQTSPQIRVEVDVDGNLHVLRMEGFATDDVPAHTQGNISLGPGSREGPMGAVKAVAHGLLFVMLLVLFFRRLDARLLDSRSALRDGLWGSLWGMISAALVVAYAILSSTGIGALPLFLAIAFSLTSAAAVLVLVFLASAVGDSYAREAWPHTLRSLDLLRRLSPLRRPVGAAVIHGLAAAAVILGVCAGALWVPGVQLSLPGTFPGERSWLPVLSAFASSTWFGLYIVLAAAAGLGGWLTRRSAIAAVALPLLFFAATDIAPVPVGPLPAAIILGALAGGVILWAFMRDGVVAAGMAIIASSVAVQLAPGWLAAPVPETTDAVIGAVLLVALLVLGGVAVATRETEEDHIVFVPDYVRRLSEQQRMERELEIARDVQTSFLPRHMPHLAGVDAAALCIPAHEVGGDYYDILVLDEHRVAIMIGDVSGKGIKAAFYMTLVKGIIQTLAAADAPPRELLLRLNQIFCRNAPRGTFISLVYGVFDARSGRFTFARAGHNPILLIRDGSATFERPSGMAIGLTMEGDFEAALEDYEVEVGEGDVIVLYTDGVSEAINGAREQFGEDGIVRALAGAAGLDATSMLHRLRRELDRFTKAQGHFDDVTMIVLRRTQTVPEPDEPVWNESAQLT